MHDRIRIFDLTEMDPDDVAALPPEDLALLQEDLVCAREELALAENRLRIGLELRYGERAAALRRVIENLGTRIADDRRKAKALSDLLDLVVASGAQDQSRIGDVLNRIGTCEETV